MVNEVVDLTLTKPRSRRAFSKRLQRLWLGISVVTLLLVCSLLWPASPRNLGVGDRLLTSQVIPLWRDGEVIVLVRHEERCDRSSNPCLGPLEGLTINGSQHAQTLGNAFKSLGMAQSDVLASPAIRTAQTLRFMFDKHELTSGERAVCGAAMGEELLRYKQPGRNLVFITHSGCIADFETSLGFPRARFPEYGSALFVQVLPNGKFKTLGIMNNPDWPAALKQF
ncbi:MULTISPECIES: lipopolysaccharide core heptose(II)-phosphate phosphatase PmrG [Pseudomonas]|jgi:phosphohistidine phosphatase SixA|uniref:Histidine phosphatase family protein n=2 Tax=Pseudomonas TaxID=286 RepID=A0A4Y9TL22_PSEFL|nr:MULTISPECIES: histidine phosphatase family protein [Pseudomonas]CRM96174.1 Lipopolysaccharide core heptose(II)-phosphate phosphatase precursor [Pseudomonas sp. 22 E 5]MCX9153380.1 histidine phosphatase family protein [Pseudomonas sp. TB1-B1]QXH65661.1 histidine phosphatase family protein [Pseudomonas asgharzadehiana]TFW44964.1 histidine phosphatase family protein [Pseudomonas fluorescens]TKJ65608.1 histidine phosphatase family protein [Pseudomonas sp. CFBP13506]